MRDTPITAQVLHTEIIHLSGVLECLKVIEAAIELLPDSGYERINVTNALAWTTGYVEAAKAQIYA